MPACRDCLRAFCIDADAAEKMATKQINMMTITCPAGMDVVLIQAQQAW